MLRIDPRQLEEMAKKGLNTCPICWLPLFIGEGPESEKFCSVQVWFKNKPSESTISPASWERNRSHTAFGMPHAVINCHGCHFLHRSSQGRNLVLWDNIWSGVTPDDPPTKRHEFKFKAREERRAPAFYQHTCVEQGIFSSAFSDTSSDLFTLIDTAGTETKIFNSSKCDKVFQKMFGLFAGCRDCNSKMTINEFTKHLFSLVYKGVGVSTRDNSIDDEGRIYYLMLSGLVKTDDIDPGEGCFTIHEADHINKRKRSWRFNVIVIWCQLQILFCLWKWSSTPAQFGHHVDHIYLGTADFYMAFILYAMHEGSTPKDYGHASLEFETFHYFYTSMYPQVKRGGAPGVQGGAMDVQHNLSLHVLGISKGVKKPVEWRYPYVEPTDSSRDLNTIRRQIHDIQKNIADFWKYNFSLLSREIHNQGECFHRQALYANREMISNSLPLFSRCKKITEQFESLRGAPTLEDSVHILTSQQYWLHFRYITFLTVNESCKRYEQYYTRLPNTCQEVKRAYINAWRLWFNTFNAKLKALWAAERADARAFGAPAQVVPVFDASPPPVVAAVEQPSLSVVAEPAGDLAAMVRGLLEEMRVLRLR